jgi:hypothetical protein
MKNNVIDHKVLSKELVVQGSEGQIFIREYGKQNARKGSVLVVPNGYGSLNYCHSVAQELSNTWSHVYTVDLRGQGRSDGQLSVHGAASDLQKVIPFVRQKSKKKTSLLVHCSAMLYLLDLSRNDPVWNSVDRILLYSYLAQPDKHLKRFLQKTKQYGVRIAEDLGISNSYSPKSFSKLPVPFAVIHPNSGLSRLRANLEELKELEIANQLFDIRIPDEGYEISDINQEQLIQEMVFKHINPLLLKQLD